MNDREFIFLKLNEEIFPMDYEKFENLMLPTYKDLYDSLFDKGYFSFKVISKKENPEVLEQTINISDYGRLKLFCKKNEYHITNFRQLIICKDLPLDYLDDYIGEHYQSEYLYNVDNYIKYIGMKREGIKR